MKKGRKRQNELKKKRLFVYLKFRNSQFLFHILKISFPFILAHGYKYLRFKAFGTFHSKKIDPRLNLHGHISKLQNFISH